MVGLSITARISRIREAVTAEDLQKHTDGPKQLSSDAEEWKDWQKFSNFSDSWTDYPRWGNR
jgi:hypothetical protein